MSGAAERLCEEAGLTVTGGVAIVPPSYPGTLPESERAPRHLQVLTGNHPTAGDDSARAGRRLLEAAQSAGPDELVLVLISGGGTALASVPVPEIDGWDLRATYRLLLRSGASIDEVNAVRKHLTRVGGGQLAAACPADMLALAVSDVPSDRLDVIASGPTVPDPSTFEDAMRVAYRYGLWHDLPASVREHLAAGARGRRAETPGAEDALGTVRTQRVATQHDAVEAAAEEARSLGYTVVCAVTGQEGEAREVARERVRDLQEAGVTQPSVWVWGGETTVTVRGDGTGGRNQELALAAALAMEDDPGHRVLLSGGTDGIDGPTDAAGAWATPSTARSMREAGVDPAAALERNDSYTAHEAAGTLLRTGPTHTNVMDLTIGLVRPETGG